MAGETWVQNTTMTGIKMWPFILLTEVLQAYSVFQEDLSSVAAN